MVEVVNMLPPPYMLPSKAPKPITPLRCAVTGKPAKYRDPVSGYGYADLEAYKELKQRLQSERRGLTGKRTKRQSSKLASTIQSTQQLEAGSDPAQLDASAAQGTVTALDAQSLAPTAVENLPMQSAAEVEIAAASDAAPAAVLIQPQAAAAATNVSGAGQAQTSADLLQLPAAPRTARANVNTGLNEAAASPVSASGAQQNAQVAQGQSSAAAPLADAPTAATASDAAGNPSLPAIHVPGGATAKSSALDTPAQEESPHEALLKLVSKCACFHVTVCKCLLLSFQMVHLQTQVASLAVCSMSNLIVLADKHRNPSDHCDVYSCMMYAGPSNAPRAPAMNQADADVAVPMET